MFKFLLRCPDTTELEPLYLPQRLYLRPIAKLNISLQLPNVKQLGKSVSHWEIMEKLKELIKPDEFSVLKVTKTTMEFVRFEAEIEKRSKLERVIDKINNKMIKLKEFREMMRVRAGEAHSDFPNPRIWDAFFAEAKDMNEMRPGERPDTIHIANLPSKWFMPYHMNKDDDPVPSEKILYKVFEKFGSIRYVDIPICDPHRKKMKEQISGLKYSSFDKMDWFEGYIQFKDYIGFTKAMKALRDMKLVHKEDDEDDDNMEVEIKVFFDKTKHLSDASIKRREIVRDRLVMKAREREEKELKEFEEKKRQEESERKKQENLKEQKELRRRVREEKRKAKILKNLKITESDEINRKIAREEKKLLKVQRKLEAVRLTEELFKRIKNKNEDGMQSYSVPDPNAGKLRKLKNYSELDFLSQKEKLHDAVQGRIVLKSILANKKDDLKRYSDSSDSDFSLDEPQPKRHQLNGQHPAELMFDNGPPHHPMYSYPLQPLYPPFSAPIYPDIDIYGIYRGNPRGIYRGFRGRGRGRGFIRRGRGNGTRGPYPQDAFEEYAKHYNKLPNEHISDKRSYSRSPRSNSHRHYSRSPRRRRSYSRSRSRSYSRGQSRSRSHRYDDSASRSRSRSRNRRKRSRSTNTNRSRKSRSKSRRRSHSHAKTRSRESPRDRKPTDRSDTKYNHEEQRQSVRSKSREKSVDSSEFLTPKQLSEKKKRSRSKSWSSTKGSNSKARSWSKSPQKPTGDAKE